MNIKLVNFYRQRQSLNINQRKNVAFIRAFKIFEKTFKVLTNCYFRSSGRRKRWSHLRRAFKLVRKIIG